MMLRTLLARFALLGGTLLVLLIVRPVLAQAPEASCSAVQETESLRAAGRYRETRVRLLDCVNAQCGGDVRRRCALALQKLDAVTPSIVVSMKDAQGNDVTDVAVSLEDQPLVSSLDGMAIPVDPGKHRFVFQRPGQAPVSLALEIREGEKFRAIDVPLESPSASPAAEPADSAAPATGWSPRVVGGATLIGVGVAGLAAFTWLGLSARSEEKELESCKPCSDARIDSVETRYLLANISLGVGVVALGSATWLLLTDSPGKAAGENDLAGLSLVAGPRGGFASYAHSF
ncbi:MAG TPA: hypothetical protein VJU61_05115 [Polyangiaceae bacterium]|nr:hypothetical protein [Polyangiaceae bacterium]